METKDKSLAAKRRKCGRNNYANGANFERWFVRYLREHGCIANRTPGSHGSYDVFSMRGGTNRLYQLKKNCKPSDEEVAELAKDAIMAGAQAFIVLHKRGGFDLLMVDAATLDLLPTPESFIQ